jgi:A/G-specific adenine glycosylase
MGYIAAFMDIVKLKEWFIREKRDLPWRNEPSPYKVWISEVMLQQTQAVVVVDYFFKWLELFPSIPSLAKASLEEVIKAWEGLGYYSRARNLHKAARYLMQHHEGALPSSIEDLSAIPGIGPYTAGAIASFAFHRRAAAVDGNVIRVISRFFCIKEDVSKPSTQKKIREAVEDLLPNEESWIVMEALIELGAKICKKSPDCTRCPVKSECRGKEQARTLPFKGKKIEVTALIRYVAVVMADGEVLVRKGDSGKVMADLYVFPYWEGALAVEKLGLSLSFVRDLPKQKHSFTRFRVDLYPALFELKEKLDVVGYEWVCLRQLMRLPFSSGHRHIAQGLVNEYFTY